MASSISKSDSDMSTLNCLSFRVDWDMNNSFLMVGGVWGHCDFNASIEENVYGRREGVVIFPGIAFNRESKKRDNVYGFQQSRGLLGIEVVE